MPTDPRSAGIWLLPGLRNCGPFGGPVVRFNAVKFSFMTVAIVPKAEIAGLLKEAFNV
jgi:hypothetical protein